MLHPDIWNKEGQLAWLWHPAELQEARAATVAAETTAAPSRSRSDRGRTWSTKQLLRVTKMDGVDVHRHPCARKQVRIVRFARREHGWARGGRRCERAAAGERYEVGFEGGSHLSGER